MRPNKQFQGRRSRFGAARPELRRWGALAMRLAVALFAAAQPFPVLALDGVYCRDLLNIENSQRPGVPSWEFAVPSWNGMYHATLYARVVPNTAQGDFDGDKKQDVAFLIKRKGQERREVAVCLSTKPKAVVYFDPGCSDDITLLGNTIVASCAEVTEDTWRYDGQKFVVTPGEGD